MLLSQWLFLVLFESEKLNKKQDYSGLLSIVAMKLTQSYFVYPRMVCASFQLKKLKIAEVYEVIFLRPQITYSKF